MSNDYGHYNGIRYGQGDTCTKHHGKMTMVVVMTLILAKETFMQRQQEKLL